MVSVRKRRDGATSSFARKTTRSCAGSSEAESRTTERQSKNLLRKRGAAGNPPPRPLLCPLLRTRLTEAGRSPPPEILPLEIRCQHLSLSFTLRHNQLLQRITPIGSVVGGIDARPAGPAEGGGKGRKRRRNSTAALITSLEHTRTHEHSRGGKKELYKGQLVRAI